jgi:hypothetical protein
VIQSNGHGQVEAAAPVVSAVDVICRMQLGTGEIPSFRREPSGGLQYLRSPLISTFVNEALACFDPRSPAWQSRTLHLVPEALRGSFVRTIARLRTRIRSFVLWQAEADGTWRFFGRGSGLLPDAGTTACAAATLLEAPGPSASRNLRRNVEAIGRFRSPEGHYYTFIDSFGRGFGWLDEFGAPVVGVDPVVNAEVLRFLSLAGMTEASTIDQLIGFVKCQAVRAEPLGSRLFPNPLCLSYAVVRAWTQAKVAGFEELATELVPRVLALQNETGDFGGPLSTAMAATILLDLGYEGRPLDLAFDAVAGGFRSPWGWAYEDFLVGGYGSPAWTSALSISVLARREAERGAYAP